MLYARSLAYLVLSYGLMGVMGLVGAPLVLWREDWTRAWNKAYIRVNFALARLLCGIRVEIRGPVPSGDVIVAAKHQSQLDVLALYLALPEARFVMKRELMWMPFFGHYAKRTGALPIDRAGGSATIRRMIEAFRPVRGQIVIYPQGTRVPPGTKARYRRGAVSLYCALDRPMILAATNGGHVWPRRGILRRPGTAVIAFLGEMPRGLDEEAAAQEIEARIEAASDRLSAEALSARSPSA